MEPIREVVTTVYDTIVVSEGLTVDFEKTVTPDSTVINGNFKKSNGSVASLSYSSMTGKYKLEIPKFDSLSTAEFAAIHTGIPEWIEEIKS